MFLLYISTSVSTFPPSEPLVLEMFSAVSMYLFVVHYSEYLITVWCASFDCSVVFRESFS